MSLHNRINRSELKQKMEGSKEPRITLSFYKYHHIGHPSLFRDHLFQYFSSLDILGRVYVSVEGINAQISVPQKNWDQFRKELGQEITFLEGVRLNIALDDDGKSFFMLKIKVRDKIVADGLNDKSFDVTRRGKHLSAEEVNAKIDQENARFVDMRNHYEWEVGHFENALLPDVENFRTALPVVEEMLKEEKEKPIIMYCTGGIRCEKASAYYLHRGFEEVYMVDGGIIEYARQCQEKNLENKFIGKNFVFDERLGERISNEVIAQCHQCGKKCDTHINCANDACHILFIQCDECAQKYAQCCSRKCQEYMALPEEKKDKLKNKIQFNGTAFGKGRYDALKKDEPLIIDG
ncbi:rhodanese-related sulfurtransferase [Membranicola marinus]|uniref:tRNA uridine(34) hydroxylase n=1 Tax=Membranihabitans marinus TaxID=1227546 RepID=A0A953L912_9BACT|nr:rhodanese-related sulfurtransferase [Membranihabitans marinus]MBY5957148.1 rhodanese-related sulfurtransferase [Membranihabitans marinus]